MRAVGLGEVVEKWGLTNLTPDIDLSDIQLTHAEVNRPALQLAGFYEYFDFERIQLIGNVEFFYIQQLEKHMRLERFEQLFSYSHPDKIPGLVYCRGLLPCEELLEMANKHRVPILMTERSTTDFMGELLRWLKVKLAPMIRIHGVLVDVFGEGVLIVGESGIGKSEAALELIKRGHRLVTDDAVDIRKVSEDTLVGSAPEMIKHFVELRGIGIIDVKMLYGVGSVKDTQTIDMVIKLEEWDKTKEYDRLGMQDNYIEYLDNKVVCYELPVRPGRNLAVIVETAAMNHRQKKMGYNAAEELHHRFQENMNSGN
ncbi:MAG: HPr(Ser) kinase/phosphatase [Lachnospiraceae bacterium]|nr:HPr(Ser) kinase/phosphatase [Lachnospiraceae bacterium]